MSDPPRSPPPDELPRSAVADPPLSLEARTPGPRGGLRGKMGLAALGLLVLFAMVAAAWAASHFSPKGKLDRPPVDLEQR
jgi:hypothetical protein